MGRGAVQNGGTANPLLCAGASSRHCALSPPLPVAVWLAYTPPAFAWDLAPLLPACCAELAARYLVPNGSFFLAAAYSAYFTALEPFAGLTWAGGCCAGRAWTERSMRGEGGGGGTGGGAIHRVMQVGGGGRAPRPRLAPSPTRTPPPVCPTGRRPGGAAAVGPGQLVPHGGGARGRLGLGAGPAPGLLVCPDRAGAPDVRAPQARPDGLLLPGGCGGRTAGAGEGQGGAAAAAKRCSAC